MPTKIACFWDCSNPTYQLRYCVFLANCMIWLELVHDWKLVLLLINSTIPVCGGSNSSFWILLPTSEMKPITGLYCSLLKILALKSFVRMTIVTQQSWPKTNMYYLHGVYYKLRLSCTWMTHKIESFILAKALYWMHCKQCRYSQLCLGY